MSRRSSSLIQKWDPFEVVVDTTIAGSSGVGNFKIPLRNTKSYRYKVDWGDGNISASTTTTNLTHTYASSGIYNVKVFGRFDQLYFNGDLDGDKVTDIISFGNIKWVDFSSALEGTEISAVTTTSPILERGPIFNQAFRQCGSLNSDLGSWDMSKVSDITFMFELTTVFNNGGSPSISGWTTSAMTDFSGTFNNAIAFNQPIGSWDTSNVIDMGSMFYGATNFDQDLSNWDISNVTTISNMFRDSNFNNSGSTGISGWTFSTGLTSISGMFYGTTNFNQDIGNWDVSNITNMSAMFRGSAFNNGGSPSISGWTTSAVTNMAGMFYNDDSFNQPIGSWDVSNVTSFGSLYNGIFEGCAAFDQDLSNWDVSKVTNLDFAFRNTSFNNGGSPHISGWTFGTGFTSLSNTFRNADAFTQPIGEWILTGTTNKRY
jgi:surface protein